MRRRLKRVLAIALAMLLLTGCGAGSETTQASTQAQMQPEQAAAPVEEATVQETEPEILEGNLFLKVSSITFSLVGETDDIYLGLIPRELVTWESEDPSIVSVDNGVLTANAVGTTTIHATYYDREVSCSAGCLAETQEELTALGRDVLCQPKRVIPEVDMDEPCTYFDDAAIIGDSIIYMMMQTESKGDYLGNIQFIARGGVSMNGMVLRFSNLYYQGKEMYLEDIIAKSQVKRAYIHIGATDIADQALRESFLENWETMLKRIREKSPDVEIVIISNIPRLKERKYSAFVVEYNEYMRKFAKEHGCMYLDVCYYIQDHEGRIPKHYNLDGFHLDDEGYLNYMKVMRYYAQYELEGGTLS